jgi:general stress protein YciG
LFFLDRWKNDFFFTGTSESADGCSSPDAIAEEAQMARGGTSNRGFASMDAERQREIASKGGRSVPAEKRSFSQDRELASEAGRKGGQASGGTRSAQDQD